MDATYERILKTINEKPRPKRDVARRALIWIAYARRPLLIDELACAISIEVDTKDLEDFTDCPDEEYILDACAGLVSVYKERYWWGPVRVRFVHFSVQEFFTSHRSTTLNIGHEVAHREIAQACMILLVISPEPSDYGRYPYETVRLLFQYALEEWPHHLRAGNLHNLPTNDHRMASTLSFFGKKPLLLFTKHRKRSPGSRFGSPITIFLGFSSPVLSSIFHLPATERRRPPPSQPVREQSMSAFYQKDHDCVVIRDDKLAVHYAVSELDSVPVVRSLYSYGYPLNYRSSSSDSEGGPIPDILRLSPLYSVQSAEMARYLLNNGISTEPQYLRKELVDPLVYFAKRGNLDGVFQLILDRIVDHTGQRLKNALRAAFNAGYLELIPLLQQRGLDINVLIPWINPFDLIEVSCNVLQAAVHVSRVEDIHQLLDMGADVNAQGGVFGNALHAAACCGKVKVVQLLLDKGADVNAQGGEYGNALQAAANSSNVGVVQLLLDKGADVNAQGGEFGNALQAAAYRGNVKVIQLLLDKGADVNAQGGEYGNALQAAVDGSNVEVVQLLLDKGADVNAQGGEYDNALQAAACCGNVELIQLLLDNGADVNAQGGWYGNALETAAFSGKVEVVQLLLDNGADAHAQGGRYGNALQAATFSGVEVVQLLLNYGADANAQGGRYGNALQAAAFSGKVGLVQLLLDNWADVNAQSGRYGNALQAAAFSGKVEVVQLLLDNGANVNAQGGAFGNVLQATAYNGKVEVVHLLLDNGADVNIQGGMFGTVLQAAACSGNIALVKLLLDKGAHVNSRSGRYGDSLEKMLATEPAGTHRMVPGDIPLLVELIKDYMESRMDQVSDYCDDSEVKDFANKLVRNRRCSLDVFRGLLERRGWNRRAQVSGLGPDRPKRRKLEPTQEA